MSTYDLSSLAPSDAEVALRSFPRRFREVLAPLGDDENIDELASRRGPDGSSALDQLATLSDRWALQEAALRQILVADAPAVPAAAVDQSLAVPDGSPVPARIAPALQRLQATATSLAASVAATPSGGWTRVGRAGADREITTLDLAREAVRAGRDTLDRVGRTLDAVRHL